MRSNKELKKRPALTPNEKRNAKKAKKVVPDVSQLISREAGEAAWQAMPVRALACLASRPLAMHHLVRNLTTTVTMNISFPPGNLGETARNATIKFGAIVDGVTVECEITE
jgi:hypothetical protein